MGNPYDFREVMKAAFGFTDRTVEEVLAEQERRHDEENKNRGKKRGSTAPKADAKPKQAELDKLNALLAKAKPRERTTDE